MKKTPSVFLCFYLVAAFIIAGKGRVFSQNTSGIITDTYAGVNRSFINPAAVADSPFCLHINFLTLHGGFQNNYLFTPRGEMGLNLLTGWRDMLRNPRTYFSKREGLNYAFAKQYGRIQGPSLSLKKDDHTFFFLTALRTGSSILRFPFHVINFSTWGLFYPPQQNLIFSESRSTPFASASWLELGLGYAYNIIHDDYTRVALGITARPMWGLHGAHFQADDLVYRVNSYQDIHLMMLNAQFQGSFPINYDNRELMLGEHIFKGRGFATDIGMTYTSKRGAHPGRTQFGPFGQDYREEYHFRMGISLIDLGYIRFRHNTILAEARGIKGLWADLDWMVYEDIFQAISEFDEVFPEELAYAGDIINTRDEEFTVFLPAAASAQFDYNLGNNLYAYLLWVQDIPIRQGKISSPSYIGVIPRYETRRFTVALPVTLSEYSKPRIGISVRYGILTIGADQPGGVMNINDMEGADFYFSIHWGLQNCRWQRRVSHPCHFHF